MVLGVDHCQILVQTVVEESMGGRVSIHALGERCVLDLLTRFSLLGPAFFSLLLESHDQVEALMNQLGGKLHNILAQEAAKVVQSLHLPVIGGA